MRAYRLLIPALCLLAACSQPSSQSSAQPLSSGAPLSGGPLPEPGRKVPADAATMRLSFAPVVKKAAPAVVNVYSRRWCASRSIRSGRCSAAAACRASGSPSRWARASIVRADGVIVTNNHVIAGGQEIRVVLGDRRELPAKVLLATPRADLAVLKIDVGRRAAAGIAMDDATTSRSATWCWPSAIRSASARP